jgi:FdhD protein
MNSGEVKALLVNPPALSLAPLPNAPTLSRATGDLLREIQIVDERGERQAICVPNERPLTVLLDDRELVTLMTLGAAPEWLVIGYLRNQRLIGDLGALESIAVNWATGTARVQSRGMRALAPGRATAATATTACALGTVFGDVMAQTQGIVLPPVDTARISRSALLSVLETVRSHDDVHRAAGSVHGCSLFQAADLWVGVEDVSRHNGIDTITGWMALHGVSGADKVLFTTGRLTGEMVMKAAFNGIPIMVTRNGVTAMGYDLAMRLGMTLFGRAANRRYMCYAGAQRFDSTS